MTRARRTRSRLGLVAALSAAQAVGGQAVMEGVMMRNGERLAIAVRRPRGDILLEVRPWRSLSRSPWLKKPMVRGFPVLLETLINGISALNFSAQEALKDGPDSQQDDELSPLAMAGTVAVALGLAVGLFVVLPHLMSLGLGALGLAGGVKTLSFHLWDGVFKLLLFVGYVKAIAYMPDIRRVFQYHGAEHKAIWAYEQGLPLSVEQVRLQSRLHPRCGTAFLFLVLGLSIVLHAVLIPLCLTAYSPDAAVLRQLWVLFLKLLMLAPISAAAYELIRLASSAQHSLLCRALSGPGLAMQLLTTFEPEDSQLEVAIAALKGAVQDTPADHVHQAR